MNMEGSNEESQVADIIAAFTALTTNQARRATYRGIVDQLRLDELRILRGQLDQLNFTRDIIASLPEEIVLNIAVYLHSLTVARLQLVSKQWYRCFSSPRVYRVILMAEEPAATRAALSPDALRSLFRNHVRTLCSLHNFKPSACIERDGDDLSREQNRNSDCLSYSAGRFSWTSGSDFRTLYLRDLRSGGRSTFTLDYLEGIRVARLSETTLHVVSPKGYCKLWDLASGQTTRLRLPSALVYRIVVGRDQFAINLGGAPDIVFGSLSSRSLKLALLEHGHIFSSMSIFHPVDDGIYFLFHFLHLCGKIFCTETNCPVHSVKRLKITWKTVQQPTSIETPTQPLPPPHQWYPCVLPDLEFSTDSTVVVSRWFQSWDPRRELKPPEGRKYLLVAYYSHKDLLKMHVFGTELEGGDDSFPPQAMTGTLMSPDGLIYYIRDDWETGSAKLCIFDPLSRNPALHREAPHQPSALEGTKRDSRLTDTPGRHAAPRPAITVGDGKLFGVIGRSRTVVWSFDPQVSLSPPTSPPVSDDR